MKEYYKNKFRVQTTRLEYWDYSCPGLYYVTICTKDRMCYFAEIDDGNVCLSDIGKIVLEELLKTPQIRDNVVLDSFIIMPNHIHMIIGIRASNDFGQNCRDTARHVSTKQKFGYLQPKSLSSIVGSFKSAVSKHCHENKMSFRWQAGYYEHIVRDEDDYAHTREYIANNPANWLTSKNNPINYK